MKKIILFDMDGTLTPARQSMEREVASKLFELHNTDYDIGIISGSGLNYIMEQCEILFDTFGKRLTNLKIYPCNGTKYYKWNTQHCKPEIVSLQSIRDMLGTTKLKNILNALLLYQVDLMNNFDFSDRLNYTGTFVDYRDSLINWCPIGRNATHHDRQIFEDRDEYFKIRKKFAKILESDPIFSGLSVKIGGTTSFDIYPHGWCKTFPLNTAIEKSDLKDYEVFFVGDRCELGGNDNEIYEYVKKRNKNNAFKTFGPERTVKIIDKLIKQQYTIM
jgi:phosphomannomutase